MALSGETSFSDDGSGITRPNRLRVTEALDLDTSLLRWRCNRCDHDLGLAQRNYKEGCLLAARDPRDIHLPFRGDPQYSFCPDPEWCSIVEVYCPGCGVLLDTEYLPPGHPLTHDVEFDLDAFRGSQG
jgi:acetophenone carboxylase